MGRDNEMVLTNDNRKWQSLADDLDMLDCLVSFFSAPDALGGTLHGSSHSGPSWARQRPGVRQSSAAFCRVASKMKSGRGLPQSKTLARQTRPPRKCAPFISALASALVLSLSIFSNLCASALASDCLHGMVASVHPLATEAGLEVLKDGGNAIDAAVAVALTLGGVDGDNSGIGGGCFMLIRRANSSLVAIDGREKAPAAATTNMFIRKGKADTRLSQTGALASGVPGALAAYEFAVEHYGKKRLKDILLPAAKLAGKGFRLGGAYARNLKREANEMARFDSTRAVFFKGTRPLREG